MNDGKKRRSSAELIPLFFSAVLLDIIPIHYCHNLYSVMYSVKSVLHFHAAVCGGSAMKRR